MNNKNHLQPSDNTLPLLTLSPGDAVYTLSLDEKSQGQLSCLGPVQTMPTVPLSEALDAAPLCGAMGVFYPNLSTQVGYLCFDPADAGKPMSYCLGGVWYTKNATTGAALSFTDGNVLLGN